MCRRELRASGRTGVAMRSLLRFGLFGSLLAIASLGALRPALASPCDSLPRIPLGYSIVPEHPCDGDSLFFVVSACRPCVDIITVGDYLGLQVVARMDVRRCG